MAAVSEDSVAVLGADEHGVPLLVYEKTSMLMEMVRMYWERNGKYLPKDPPET